MSMAQAMRSRMTQVPIQRRPLIDTCGTGGDGAGTFNILELNALDPAAAAAAVTTVRVADGFDANHVKATCYERFNVSLGGGLGQLHGKAFRIGHMGDTNEPTVLGALASLEATFQLCGVPYGRGGVSAAVDHLAATLAR